MKHDKHKAKRSAKYKKQHVIPMGNSANKNEKSTPTIGRRGAWDVAVGDHPAGSAAAVGPKEGGGILTTHQAAAVASILIEKEHEKRKMYSKRKIIDNWNRYDDFDVDKERATEVCTEARGEDFQKLLSKQGDASSQLRMKDEMWRDEEDKSDEAETEIGKLFKIDFVDVSHRLEAVPLHDRLGISNKYFDEELLDKINEDAAEHAKKYQEILYSASAQIQDVAASSNGLTDKQTLRGLSEPMPGSSKENCEINRLQKVEDKDNHRGSHEDIHEYGQMGDEMFSIDNERQQLGRSLEQSELKDIDSRTSNMAGDGSSCGNSNVDDSTLAASAPSCNETASTSDINEPSSKQQTKPDEEENLEDWLDDILDE